MIHLKYRKHVKADDGGHGEGGLRTGKNGEDIVLDVPVGTVAKDAETEEVLFATTISRRRPTRHPATPSLVKKARKAGSSWNSSCSQT